MSAPDDLPTDIESAFYAALDLPTAQRGPALDDLFAKWPQHVPEFRKAMAAGRTTATPGTDRAPTHVGPYRVLDEIAKGGMGIVYAAEQTHPVRRRVAVKVIKPGLDSREVLARFEQEQQALAMMNHPHIAKVLEAGTTPSGQPFFAMEFVAGDPITTFVDKNRLTTRERLALFAQVCDGVQHAHQKGVIHRDIKPSNILVTFQDGKPHSKIIDFGVAKAIQQPLTDKTIYTVQGQLVGTPEYMSPEQAEMTGVAVDTRSDIYSLGVLLYELLTGCLPFDRDAFRKAGLQGMLRILREQEPEKPSTKVTTIGKGGAELANRRRTELGALKRLLRGDLDWITIKALEKDPSRRYQSSGELSADVLRHLRDEPVMAGPPTFFYRMSKLARRHKGPIAAATAVLAAIVVGLVASLWLLDQARANEARAVAASDEAARNADAAREARAVAEATSARLSAVLADVTRLQDDARSRAMTDELDALWPARPDRLGELRAWIEDAKARTERRAKDLLESGPRTPNEVAVAERAAIEVQRALIRRVEERVKTAETVEDATITRPAEAWRAAQASVASDARYAGVRLEPQLGLIPFGTDPASGLLEFAHFGSGTIAKRDRDRTLVRPEGFALVFVLIPPGHQTWIGVQKTDPGQPNYDPDANPNELERSPARRVEVAPFFLSKYEVTQAQWRALSEGQEPSRLLGEDNPVEFIDQPAALRVLGWHEMELPTEMEWEYACRAGTTTPWYTGATRESLMGSPVAANIADATLLERGAPRDRFDIWEEYDDEMGVHGPVGSLRPNAFGLHDMLGNVFELCIVGEGPHAPGQPAVVRGGAWNRNAAWARATAHMQVPAEGTRFENLGLRPLLRLRAR